MIAIADPVAAELGAKARTFKTVAGALLWYAEQRLRKEGIASIVIGEEGRFPRSPEAIAQAHATYARIAGCLKERDDADYDFDPPVTKARLEGLLTYYQQDDDNEPQHLMAERLGMTWPGFLRECRRTRNVIKRRMREARLIDD